VDHLSEQAILAQGQLKLLARCNGLEQVEESWAGEQRLQADVHEAIDLLSISKAFVWLGEVRH